MFSSTFWPMIKATLSLSRSMISTKRMPSIVGLILCLSCISHAGFVVAANDDAQGRSSKGLPPKVYLDEGQTRFVGLKPNGMGKKWYQNAQYEIESIFEDINEPWDLNIEDRYEGGLHLRHSKDDRFHIYLDVVFKDPTYFYGDDDDSLEAFSSRRAKNSKQSTGRKSAPGLYGDSRPKTSAAVDAIDFSAYPRGQQSFLTIGRHQGHVSVGVLIPDLGGKDLKLIRDKSKRLTHRNSDWVTIYMTLDIPTYFLKKVSVNAAKADVDMGKFYHSNMNLPNLVGEFKVGGSVRINESIFSKLTISGSAMADVTESSGELLIEGDLTKSIVTVRSHDGPMTITGNEIRVSKVDLYPANLVYPGCYGELQLLNNCELDKINVTRVESPAFKGRHGKMGPCENDLGENKSQNNPATQDEREEQR